MPISRRDFLRLSALGIGSSLLAACGVRPPKKNQGNPQGNTQSGNSARPAKDATPAAPNAPTSTAPNPAERASA